MLWHVIAYLRPRWKRLGIRAILSACIILVGLVGYRVAAHTGADLRDFGEHHLIGDIAIADARAAILRSQRENHLAILLDDPGEAAALAAAVETYLQEAQDAWSRYTALELTDAERPIAARIEQDLDAWLPVARKTAAEAAKGTPDGDRAASAALTEGGALVARLAKGLDALTAENHRLARQSIDEAAQDIAAARWLLVGAIVASLALGTLLVLRLVGSFTGSATGVVAAVQDTLASLAVRVQATARPVAGTGEQRGTAGTPSTAVVPLAGGNPEPRPTRPASTHGSTRT